MPKLTREPRLEATTPRCIVLRIAARWALLALSLGACGSTPQGGDGGDDGGDSVGMDAGGGTSCYRTGDYLHAADPDLSAQIDAFLEPLVASGDFYGSVTVSKGCTITVDRGYGYARLPSLILDGAPPSADTAYHIGSITKNLVAVAIMMLRERGLLDLDQTAASLIPGFPTDGGKDAITIEDLLAHRSGLPDYIGLLLDYQAPDPYTALFVPWTDAEIFAVFEDQPLDFAPGTSFRYSNSNYFLLGLVIEVVSGDTFQEFIAENILDPLEMHDSGVGLPSDEHAAQGLIRVVRESAPGVYALDHLAPGPDMDPSFLHAAGGAYSTPMDLLRFVNALRSDALLTPASVELMTAQVSQWDARLGLWYGYGIGDADSSSPFGTGLWHSGTTHTFKNFWLALDANDITVIVNRNISEFEYLPEAQSQLGRVVAFHPLDDVQIPLFQMVYDHYAASTP